MRSSPFAAGLPLFRWRELIQSEAVSEPNVLLQNLSLREIPSLYGLRGIAALVVVVYHYSIDWKIGDFPGYYSVTLFFELSGLLITWLLLKEIDLTSTVDLKQFYLRRSLRLFPVFYVVWTICRLAGPFAGSWAYFFYLGDYFTALTGRYSVLTSAWSLGVEEKFYLLWPQLVVRAGLTRLTKVLVGILVLEPVYRWILTLAGREYYTHFAFDATLDPIVLGCLIAILAKRGWAPPSWMRHPLSLIAVVILGGVFWKSAEVVMFALAFVLLYVIQKPPRLLNNPPVRFLGLISYSLYLCHAYTAGVIWPLVFKPVHGLSSYVGLPIQVCLAIGVATLLHYAVERPFLKLKDRFHPRRNAMRAAG